MRGRRARGARASGEIWRGAFEKGGGEQRGGGVSRAHLLESEVGSLRHRGRERLRRGLGRGPPERAREVVRAHFRALRRLAVRRLGFPRRAHRAGGAHVTLRGRVGGHAERDESAARRRPREGRRSRVRASGCDGRCDRGGAVWNERELLNRLVAHGVESPATSASPRDRMPIGAVSNRSCRDTSPRCEFLRSYRKVPLLGRVTPLARPVAVDVARRRPAFESRASRR